MIPSMESVAESMAPRMPVIDSSGPEQMARDEGRSDGQPVGIRRVLLATDLSWASKRAAEEAIHMAAESGAQLVVLSVIDPGGLRLPGGRFVRRVDQERARIGTGVQTLVSHAQAAGVRATFLVWEGDPAEAILAAAESERVDVIVLGSHGRGLLGRLILGSTSARVSEQAGCRVLVVAG